MSYKKVINNKLYNTDTALLLGEWIHSNPSDFRHKKEKLYLTKKGEYFLHGKGGAMTEYASNNFDNSCSAGETIKAFSYEEAYLWAEKRELTTLIEKQFKDSIEEA